MNRQIKSSPFIAPKAPELLYARELWGLIKAMMKDYQELIDLYKDKRAQVAMDARKPERKRVSTASGKVWLSTQATAKLKALGEKWEKVFTEYAETHAPRYVEKLLKQSDSQIKAKLGDMLGKRMELIGETVPIALRQTMNAHIAENIALIKSIPQQNLLKVQESLYRCLSGGLPVKQFRQDILKAGAKDLRRATLIANDQTRKIYQNLTLRRFQQVGIQKAEWFHVAVKTPREYHQRRWDGISGKRDGHPNGLNGFIFNIDNPPIIDEKTNVRGYPGQLINCKCGMRAIIE